MQVGWGARFSVAAVCFPKAASKVAQLSSTVVIDINEGRKLPSEGSACVHG